MYKNANELINENISTITENSICNMLEIGIVAYKRIIKENELLFNNSLSSNINQRLLAYCVARQFGADMIDSEIPFTSDIRKVNSFGYKVVELKNNMLTLHISKNKNLLPKKAGYKLDLCLNNDFESNQQVLEEFKDKTVKVVDSPYYGFINYYINRESELEYVNIVIPNYNMSEVIYSKRIFDKNSGIKLIDNIDDKEIEKRIVTIKSEIENKNIL